MNEKFNIPIAKHLEDEDDLFKKRDAELIPGQDSLALNMANSIYEHAIAHNFKILLFCISPKKRAKETSDMVRKILENKPIKLNIITEIDPNLREIDQGEFVLPDTYKARDHFEGLKKASKIFSIETFDSKDHAKDNLNYHFGDPLLQKDGTYKYPELKEYFNKEGESYKEVLLRFYNQVIKFSENMERFKDKVEPVIFTHGQPHQIFTNLAQVAEKVYKEDFYFEVGELPRICWNLYKEKRQGVIPFGQIAFVSIKHVCNHKMIDILKREIEYLKCH